MQPRGLEQVLVHSWEFAFKLHRPHSLMHCTWRTTQGTSMRFWNNVIFQLYFRNKEKTTTIHNKKKQISICFSYSLSHRTTSRPITAMKVTNCVYARTLIIQDLLYTIWFHPWPIQVWRPVLYDRLGQRLSRTGYIPLRGVSLTFIDQTDPLVLLLPAFVVVGWVYRKQSTSYLTARPYAFPFRGTGSEMHYHDCTLWSSPCCHCTSLKISSIRFDPVGFSLGTYSYKSDWRTG